MALSGLSIGKAILADLPMLLSFNKVVVSKYSVFQQGSRFEVVGTHVVPTSAADPCTYHSGHDTEQA
jgi:hypothetical protein